MYPRYFEEVYFVVYISGILLHTQSATCFLKQGLRLLKVDVKTELGYYDNRYKPNALLSPVVLNYRGQTL